MIEVVAPGPFTTVQDAGRHGYKHLGVTTSGAADRGSFDMANRLLGNRGDAAALEIMLGQCVLRFAESVPMCLTGAPLEVTVDGRPVPMNTWYLVRAGQVLRCGAPAFGLRTYLAVGGGIQVEPQLGSRSTDTLGGLGPQPLRAGDVLSVDPVPGRMTTGVDCVRTTPTPDALHTLEVTPGPRRSWFTDRALQMFTSAHWTLTAQANRVGVRLNGPRLDYARTDQPFSEGMVLGAVQVPPAGRPIVFMPDHPTTGGYPVIAVVARRSIDVLAQLRPGQSVKFHWRQQQ